jgi:hypothetical protein
MTYAEYAALPGLRASNIKAGRTSMLHMREAVVGPPRKETDALRLGRLVHAAILEPAVLLPQLAVFDGDKRTKDWSEFKDQHADRIIVDRDEAEAVGAISAAVHADPQAAYLLASTVHEFTAQWTARRYGHAKARLDGWGAGLIVEVKTTRHQTERAVTSQFVGMGYDLGIGWYAEAICSLTGDAEPPPCWFIVASAVRPYWCKVLKCEHENVKLWRKEAVDIAAAYRKAEASGKFVGPLAGVDTFRPPAWATGGGGDGWEVGDGEKQGGEL